MYLLCCALVLLLAVHEQCLHVGAYSRDERTFTYSVDDFNSGHELLLRFDPFLKYFDDSIQEICESYLRCEKDSVESFMDSLIVDYKIEIRHKMQDVFRRSVFSSAHEGRTNAFSRYKWLDHADNATYHEVMTQKHTSEQLWAALWGPQTTSVSISKPTTNISHLSLHEIVRKLSVEEYFLNDNPTSEGLLAAANRLFNKNQYESSFALAIYLFLHQKEYRSVMPPLSVSQTKTKTTALELNVERKLNLLSLLSEMCQINNDVFGVITFYAETLMLLSSQAIYVADDFGLPQGPPIRGLDSLNAYLARIRVVLFMPILPSTYDIAAKQRAAMIDDINIITESILTKEINVPIQVKLISSSFNKLKDLICNHSHLLYEFFLAPGCGG